MKSSNTTRLIGFEVLAETFTYSLAPLLSVNRELCLPLLRNGKRHITHQIWFGHNRGKALVVKLGAKKEEWLTIFWEEIFCKITKLQQHCFLNMMYSITPMFDILLTQANQTGSSQHELGKDGASQLCWWVKASTLHRWKNGLDKYETGTKGLLFPAFLTSKKACNH